MAAVWSFSEFGFLYFIRSSILWMRSQKITHSENTPQNIPHLLLSILVNFHLWRNNSIPCRTAVKRAERARSLPKSQMDTVIETGWTIWWKKIERFGEATDDCCHPADFRERSHHKVNFPLLNSESSSNSTIFDYSGPSQFVDWFLSEQAWEIQNFKNGVIFDIPQGQSL